MNNNVISGRSMLAGAIVSVVLGAGCVAIISSDQRYHDPGWDDCAQCHDAVVVVTPYKHAPADTSAVGRATGGAGTQTPTVQEEP